MPRHDDRLSLRHMLDHAREAVALCVGKQRADLAADRLLQLGLTRLIEIVGEAASRVSAPTRERYQTIPWSVVVGMRHRLIHGYDVVDLNVLWDTVLEDLPPLIRELEAVFRSDPSP